MKLSALLFVLASACTVLATPMVSLSGCMGILLFGANLSSAQPVETGLVARNPLPTPPDWKRAPQPTADWKREVEHHHLARQTPPDW
ncbi:uncharacterized protein F5147DRAFT_713265 [Suillus discolor]|uniref:Uncharacterized protein n=1 Tax=Suillus discolor TaxID=1912936 RepID=A0A9P7F032_9AGAM|nr:uncharacterized protein F5147DRAFT_713265 [Suillus discolor]KAG2098698.1 hypothetical protein F5147DRAFT_713265 [Suillus discolor]